MAYWSGGTEIGFLSGGVDESFEKNREHSLMPTPGTEVLYSLIPPALVMSRTVR